MESKRIRRRNFLKTSTAATAALATMPAVKAAPTAKILETKVISQLPAYYHGWPTLARRKSGELLVVCSGGREDHVCPFGRVDFMRSVDGGGNVDVSKNRSRRPNRRSRCRGVVETAKGSILITTFYVAGLRATAFQQEGRDGEALAGARTTGSTPTSGETRARLLDDPLDRRRRDVFRTLPRAG